MGLQTLVNILTAVAGFWILYLLQKPYVRAVKLFRDGKVDLNAFKLKNAGAATAICVVLQDRYEQVIDVDVRLGHQVRYADALPPGGQITIGIPDGSQPVCIYYENLFGFLFRTELTDAGDRFRMTARKVWPFMPPAAVLQELPARWWRRHG